jgi:hypothetical protein
MLRNPHSRLMVERRLLRSKDGYELWWAHLSSEIILVITKAVKLAIVKYCYSASRSLEFAPLASSTLMKDIEKACSANPHPN